MARGTELRVGARPEGLVEPFAWAQEVSDLYPEDAVRKIMGGNMFGLLGLKQPA